MVQAGETLESRGNAGKSQAKVVKQAVVLNSGHFHLYIAP